MQKMQQKMSITHSITHVFPLHEQVGKQPFGHMQTVKKGIKNSKVASVYKQSYFIYLVLGVFEDISLGGRGGGGGGGRCIPNLFWCISDLNQFFSLHKNKHKVLDRCRSLRKHCLLKFCFRSIKIIQIYAKNDRTELICVKHMHGLLM